MKVACIKERRGYGYVLSLVDAATKLPATIPSLILVGDEAKETRLLKAAIEGFEKLAPIAGITRELKELCKKHHIEISPKWRVHYFSL